MTDARPIAAAAPPKASWADLFRDGRAAYSTMVIVGVAVHALQILVIAIIMPTVVHDIGGAAYYTWAAMAYTIGSIVGAAGVGPVWAAFGRRRGYALSAFLLLVGTTGCALAPDMAWLIVARSVQGLAGGLVVGGGMSLVGGLFSDALRRRILAMYQGTWMVAQLFGPVVGGAFAEIGWWRGSFWTMVPVILTFAVLAWLRLPEGDERKSAEDAIRKFPIVRLAMLGTGVFTMALAGAVSDGLLRAALIVGALALLALTFRLDTAAENRLYPSGAFSARSPVGLALWILFSVGMVQTSVTLFLPLLLQVVHGVSPLFISFVSIVISGGWTVGTFLVSGWSGARERFALWVGPLLMIVGLVGVTATAQMPVLVVLTLAAFIQGFGAGTHNVHLLARTMANAAPGEEGITAAAMPSIRSLGTAFGAATAGLLANVAGLGDAVEPAAVGNAITVVYGFALLPLTVAALFMFRLVRLGAPARAAGEAAAS